jgi:hypothetical protein
MYFAFGERALDQAVPLGGAHDRHGQRLAHRQPANAAPLPPALHAAVIRIYFSLENWNIRPRLAIIANDSY